MSFTGTVYQGQANRGVDRQITIRRNDTGAQIQVGGRLSDLVWSDKDTIEEIDGIDNGGRVDHLRYPGGITGSITITRYNGDYESFSKFYDATFYAGGAQIFCTIVMGTNNGFDQSQNIDTFTYAVLGKLKSGPFASKKSPQVTFDFEAQERI